MIARLRPNRITIESLVSRYGAAGLIYSHFDLTTANSENSECVSQNWLPAEESLIIVIIRIHVKHA